MSNPRFKVCQYCEASFVPRYPANPNKFCSRKCADRAKSLITGPAHPDYKPRIELKCAECGTPFHVKPHKVAAANPKDRARYCSNPCQHAAKRKLTGALRYNFKGGDLPVACVICGTVKMRKRVNVLSGRSKTCSHRCTAILTQRSFPRVSSLELMMSRAFAAAGVKAEAQYQLDRCAADFAFPEKRLIVECDGAYWHGRPEQKKKDARRDAWLRARGWKVLRLGEAEIKASPERCVERVLAVLRRPALARAGTASRSGDGSGGCASPRLSF